MADEKTKDAVYDTGDTSKMTNSESATGYTTTTQDISAPESGIASISENPTVTVGSTIEGDTAQPFKVEEEINKVEAEGEGILDEKICDELRLSKTTLSKFRNPYEEIRLSYWKEDMKVLVQNVIKSVSNVDGVLRKLLEEKVFIIIYQEGFYKHKEIMDLLTFLQEPFQLVSTKVLESNELSYDFWEFELKPMVDPPFIIFEDKVYRNLEELEELLYRKLVSKPVVNKSKEKAENEYDLVIIGNTVAGKTAAIEANKFTDSVLLINCIEDSYSAKNTSIKIMYASTKMLENIRLGYRFGFCNTESVKLIWKDIVDIADVNTKRSSFKERLSLREINTINARPKFTANGELKLLSTEENSEDRIIKGTNYIIATGSSPKFPTDIIGLSEQCFSVEKLITMKENPSDTLFIGDSSEGLECAGILNACEFKVTVVVCSGMHDCQNYEQSFVKEIRKVMEVRGVRFIDGCRILKVSPTEKNFKKVEGLYEDGSVFNEEFKTVVISIGRIPSTSYLGLSKIGVKVSKSRHIIVDQFDRTCEPNVFALGRVAEGKPESDSYEEKSAKYLIQRLFNFGSKKVKYGPIPKSVFTPLEYGCVGLTEKLAQQLLEIKLQNLKNVLIYENIPDTIHQIFPQIEIKLKLLCSENDNGDKMILGIHILGSNIGELIQGMSSLVGNTRPISRFNKLLSCSLCKNIFDNLVLTKTLPIQEKIDPVVNIENLEGLIRIINTGKHGTKCMENKDSDENVSKDNKQLMMEESNLYVVDNTNSHSECTSVRSRSTTEDLIYDYKIYGNESDDSEAEENSSTTTSSSSSSNDESSEQEGTGESSNNEDSSDSSVEVNNDKNIEEDSQVVQETVEDNDTTEENKLNIENNVP